MTTRAHQGLSPETLAARVAGMIGDPVLRLRFLKVMRPPARRRRRRLGMWMVWPALVLAVIAFFLAKHAAGKPEAAPAVTMRAEPPVIREVAQPASVWQVEKLRLSSDWVNRFSITCAARVRIII